MEMLELKVRAPESDCRGLNHDFATEKLSDLGQIA